MNEDSAGGNQVSGKTITKTVKTDQYLLQSHMLHFSCVALHLAPSSKIDPS